MISQYNENSGRDQLSEEGFSGMKCTDQENMDQKGSLKIICLNLPAGMGLL